MMFEYDLAKIKFNEGLLFYKKENFLKAEDSFEEANRIFPNRTSVLINLINVKIILNKFIEADDLIKIVLNINPLEKKILFSKAMLLAKKGQFEDSLKLLDNFINDADFSNEERSDFYILKGTILSKLGHIERSEKSYVLATKLEPTNDNAFWHLALNKLYQSKFEEGWELYEYRLKKKYLNYENNVKNLDDIKGKIILIQHEQGYGDIIQFARYIAVLRNICKKIFFLIPQELNNLFSNLNVETVNSEKNLIFDKKIFLMSIPKLMFKQGINYYHENYLNLSLKKTAKYFKNKKPNVGLAWSGREDYPYDFLRSIPLVNFKKILDLENNFNFFCLQKDIRAQDREFYQKYNITYVGDNTFFEVAKLINSLDLVISSDTSILHLSGTLMKETFALLPFVADWRWGSSNFKTPWYSSVRIFRCQDFSNNWMKPIDDISNFLNKKYKN